MNYICGYSASTPVWIWGELTSYTPVDFKDNEQKWWKKWREKILQLFRNTWFDIFYQTAMTFRHFKCGNTIYAYDNPYCIRAGICIVSFIFTIFLCKKQKSIKFNLIYCNHKYFSIAYSLTALLANFAFMLYFIWDQYHIQLSCFPSVCLSAKR